jgi:hypothetical protein
MHIELPLADTTVHLLPEGALWWPDGATLGIADLHLGKAATFRARGLPVPGGTTRGNLDRLSWLFDRYPQARRLVVLGDFLHAAEAHNSGVLCALAEWRARHAEWELVLVRGNHDSHAGDPPPWLDAWTSPGRWAPSPAATIRSAILNDGCWQAICTPPPCCAAAGAMPCACPAS